MNKFAILLSVLGALALAGCDQTGGSADVPAQSYLNGLAATVAHTGDLRGQIVFPSEFAQHSIRFTVNELTFVTHPDGRFRVANVPTGDHRLEVRIKGYEPVNLQVKVERDGDVEVGPVRLVDARGRVLGRLVAERGDSAAGVEVRLVPDDGMAVTDNEGIFQFLGVSAGNHTLMVKDPRFFAGNQHFSLSSNELRNLGNIRVYPQVRGDTRTARLPN